MYRSYLEIDYQPTIIIKLLVDTLIFRLLYSRPNLKITIIYFCSYLEMRILFLVSLLLTQPHSIMSEEKEDQRDIQFLLSFTKSYLCTGNNDWWKKIPDPVLRVTMQIAVLGTCRTEKNITRAVKILRSDTREAMRDTKFKQKRNEVGECLWGTLRQWLYLPFLCPLKHKELASIYDKWLNKIHQELCNVNEEADRKESKVCKLTGWTLEILQKIRGVIGDVCYIGGINNGTNPDSTTSQQE